MHAGARRMSIGCAKLSSAGIAARLAGRACPRERGAEKATREVATIHAPFDPEISSVVVEIV